MRFQYEKDDYSGEAGVVEIVSHTVTPDGNDVVFNTPHGQFWLEARQVDGEDYVFNVYDKVGTIVVTGMVDDTIADAIDPITELSRSEHCLPTKRSMFVTAAIASAKVLDNI